MEYRTIDTRTIKGLRAAERLKAQGWRIVATGLFLVRFSRSRPKKGAKP